MAKIPICVKINGAGYKVPAGKYAVVTVQGLQSNVGVVVSDAANALVGRMNVGSSTGQSPLVQPSTGIVLPANYTIAAEADIPHICSGFLYDI